MRFVFQIWRGLRVWEEVDHSIFLEPDLNRFPVRLQKDPQAHLHLPRARIQAAPPLRVRKAPNPPALKVRHQKRSRNFDPTELFKTIREG